MSCVERSIQVNVMIFSQNVLIFQSKFIVCLMFRLNSNIILRWKNRWKSKNDLNLKKNLTFQLLKFNNLLAFVFILCTFFSCKFYSFSWFVFAIKFREFSDIFCDSSQFMTWLYISSSDSILINFMKLISKKWYTCFQRNWRIEIISNSKKYVKTT